MNGDPVEQNDYEKKNIYIYDVIWLQKVYLS